MRSWVFLHGVERRTWAGLWAGLLFTFLFAPPVEAQLSFVTPAAADSAVAKSDDDLLARGRELESQRRWGEALSFYEDAVRQHPNRSDLKQRLNSTRLHYDLGRRYNDDSFRRSLTALAERDALELYNEVLLKIQAHYVVTPDWADLVRRGAEGLDAALSDPVFVEWHLANQPRAKIDHFRRELTARVANVRVEHRHAASDTVAWVARWAREQLGLSTTAAILECICGATGSLDPYSTYLTSGQLNEVYSQIEGNFVGLGIELKATDGALQIVNVIAGSPADRGGIRIGDRILAVDGQLTDTLSTDEAANLLQGQEGTTVRVRVAAPGSSPRDLQIRREQVEIPSISNARILDEQTGVAYVKLACFQKTTSRDLDTALWSLHRQGMRSLIIDLRGNPGGLLTTSVDVVDKFVDSGTIVSTRGRSPREDYSYSAHRPGTWRVPLVVLIDGDSASASEIFAGAIRDHRRGTIVGVRSYGKGSVQGIFPLNVGNAGLRLTTARFYSPHGHPISDVGVDPDVVVQSVARPLVQDDGVVSLPISQDDAMLDAALNVARRQMARR